MHNIHDLEKRWLRYKLKSFIPHLLISLMVIISIALILSIINKKALKEEIAKVVLNKNMQKPIGKKIIEEVQVMPLKQEVILQEIKKEAKKIIRQEEKKIILSPSLDFIKNMHTNTINNYQSNDFQKRKQTPKKQYKKNTTPKPKKRVKKTQRAISQKHILIQKQETQADISQVLQRFQKNNNPALSLFVAKKYYRLGDYSQAYNYALLTNQINSNIDESWIIFAKSLIKLHKKDQAIKILKSHIKQSNSVNAKILLDDIKSGKFK